MKKILALIIAVVASWNASAQQEIMISQYMFNGLVLNPAYAGTHQYWSASALHRSQWVKFDEAPTTQTVCIDGPIANRKFGVGLTLSNDRLGVTNQMEAGLNFSAKVAMGPGNLSAGLRVAGSSYSANLNDVTIWDTQDPVYANNIQNAFSTKVGLGLYYYTADWFVGLSVPTVFSADKNVLSESSDSKRFFENHYYLNGGYVIPVSPIMAIKPSVLVKYENAAPLEMDFNCNVMFFQKFWLGLGWRTGDALIAMAEWNITNQLRLGYAYDYTLTDIGNYSSGSHEIMLGFDFGRDVNVKARSPRYF